MINRGYVGSTWQDKFKLVKAKRSEIVNHYGQMTDYERSYHARELNDYQEAYEPYILGGALSEWHDTCDRVIQAFDNVKKAQADEVKRFDGQKLAGEMSVINMLVDNALSVNGLDNYSIPVIESIYDEYMSSGDLHKQRAAGEVFKGLSSHDLGNDLDLKLKVNKLITRAKEDLVKVRSYKPLDKAEDEARQAVNELNGAKSMLFEIDMGLGYTLPNGLMGHSQLVKAIRDRVDNTGSRLVVKPRQED